MAAPEAAMDEDRRVPFRQDDIGFSRQVLPVQTEAKAGSEQQLSQPDFRFRVLADVFDEYAEITNAVLDGEPAKAEKAMRRHMRAARERLSRLPVDAFPLL